jgi:hypothetical protein
MKTGTPTKIQGKRNIGTHKNMDHVKMTLMETDQATGSQNW